MKRTAMALIVAMSVTGLAADADAAKKRAAAVKVDRVISEPLSQTMPVIGRFVARQTGVVAALMRGPVAVMEVNIGDTVNKGDVVARLVTERMEWSRRLEAAELKEKLAGLQTAEAQLALTKHELKRLGSLRKSAAFSQARYDDKTYEVVKYRSEVGEKEAAVGSARAELRLADIDLYNGAIRAPYGGVVSRKHTVAGAYVNVGDPVITLINDTDLEIEADVPAERVGGLTIGRTVAVRLDDGARRRAVVRARVPDENALTRTRPVRFVLDTDGAKPRKFAANQSVTVMVPIGTVRQVVSVHKDAVIPRGGQNIVFAAVDGKAEKRVVRLGVAIGGRFEVLGGLKVGDVVVVRGNERLRPGQSLKYKGMPKSGAANNSAPKEGSN